MRSSIQVKGLKKDKIGLKIRNIMKCLCSPEQLKRVNDMVPFPESPRVVQPKHDAGNIDEAESSLRESGPLNYEEARALLGRYEYQNGNIEGALHVFEGIDFNTVTPNVKLTLARIGARHRRRLQTGGTLPTSIHAVSLLFEALYLKAKSLRALRRFTEAAQSCCVILDIVESSLPDGLPENFGADCKLQETLIKAIVLLPDLWKLAGCPEEAILSYRRALLRHWNLDAQNTAKIQKEFAVYLLFGGCEANPPNLLSQIQTSFVPKNNLEEAILLLMILLKKVNLRIIEWDPSILELLSFALSVCNQPQAFACLVEELLPGFIERKEIYNTLVLCYDGNGDTVAALNLLRSLFAHAGDQNYIPGLVLASKICCQNPNFAEEGTGFARKAVENMEGECKQMVGVVNSLLGTLFSECALLANADSDRVARQSEAIQALETAGKLTKLRDSEIVYQLSLQHAEQRKLDTALYYAKQLLELEGGSTIKGWLLLSRILSAQKRYVHAETIIDAALDQTSKWDQGQLLRTKAKLQIAQGHVKKATEIYAHLLAVLQVKSKSCRSGKKILQDTTEKDRLLELETWKDLAYMYISLSKWNDVEICLSKIKAINPYCASRWHVTGSMYEAKGNYKQALGAYTAALDSDPTHVLSLISSALALRQLSSQSYGPVRCFLINALQIDRMNHTAWHHLGLLYKASHGSSLSEAAECFKAAAFLEETSPVEPFR